MFFAWLIAVHPELVEGCIANGFILPPIKRVATINLLQLFGN
jgi:hypothetical protein